jgi:import receptor subunit TOM70
LPMSSEDTFADRVSSFISENKRGIVIGVAAAAVAVGGVAYYVASSRADGGGRDEESLRAAKKKDKKKKKSSKTVKDQEGPILEERKPKADGLLLRVVSLKTAHFFQTNL